MIATKEKQMSRDFSHALTVALLRELLKFQQATHTFDFPISPQLSSDKHSTIGHLKARFSHSLDRTFSDSL